VRPGDAVNLEAELSQPLARMEAELAHPPVPPWTGVMVLPPLCKRGHPWAVYGYHHPRGFHTCRRCKILINSGRVLTGRSWE
jgi:hypothetical protein